jgi:protein-L-isoaspartate(D-aspartate) O-methyltransferase
MSVERNENPSPSPDAPPENTLHTLVAGLQARGLLSDPRHAAAFSAVPRHLFLPEVAPSQVYEDDAIPTKLDTDGRVISSSSQPSMMLMMLRQLDLQPGHNVLEIGAGTGYNAAIMQHIVGQRGRVTTIEYDLVIAREAMNHLQRAGFYNVLVVNQDGVAGYAPRAAYDRIIATVGVFDIPLTWQRQLKQDGIIVAPIMLDGAQVSAAFVCAPDDGLESAHNLPCGFVLMQGVGAVSGLVKRVTSTGMSLVGSQLDKVDTAALHLLLSADQDECQISGRLHPQDIWRGLVFYFMLNHAPEYTFALYSVNREQKAYGIEGAGIALFSPGSACLIPYDGKGTTHCFAGADSFMEVERMTAEWVALGRPTSDQLRLRLFSKHAGPPEVMRGTVYERPEHYLHAWLDPVVVQEDDDAQTLEQPASTDSTTTLDDSADAG